MYYKAWIETLTKPEHKLVLGIIDAQDHIKEETSLYRFVAQF